MLSQTLFITDLDGTLLNAEKKLSHHTVEVLKKLNLSGIKIAVATARTKTNTLIPLGAESRYIHAFCYLNGAVIEDNNGQLLRCESISEATLKLLFDIFHAQKLSASFLGLESRVSILNHPECEEVFRIFHESSRSTSIAETCKTKTHLIALYGKNLIQIKKYIISKFCDVEVSMITPSKVPGFQFCFIQPRGCDKGSALQLLSQTFNVMLANTVAIGDGASNDMSMLELAGTSVAMKNADSALIEISDFVTQSAFNEDGVANFLESFFNLNEY